MPGPNDFQSRSVDMQDINNFNTVWDSWDTDTQNMLNQNRGRILSAVPTRTVPNNHEPQEEETPISIGNIAEET